MIKLQVYSSIEKIYLWNVKHKSRKYPKKQYFLTLTRTFLFKSYHKYSQYVQEYISSTQICDTSIRCNRTISFFFFVIIPFPFYL